MSDFVAHQALSRMNGNAVAVAVTGSMMAHDLQRLAAANTTTEAEAFMARRDEVCQAYGFTSREQRKPFAFSNGIAVIPVSGSLINRFGYSFGYVTGYNFIRRQLAQAMADDDVKGVIFDVNSYGGEVAGCFELVDDIYAARASKPMISVIDSNCYSAGYAIASAAHKIVLTPSGGTGSIGVVAMHMNMEKMLDNIGIEIQFITFGAHKVDGNAYEALSDEAKAAIQASVNSSGEKFVATIARNRGIDAAKIKGTEARTYRAEEAKSLGLIDTIAAPNAAAQVFFDELSGSVQPTEEEKAMTAETKPGAATGAEDSAKAASDARMAEKARIKGITGCEEAKGRTALANHLAMDTELSVEAAQGILKAAPVEKVEEAAKPNQFQEAMDKGGTPGVGEGKNGAPGGEGADTTKADADAIMTAFSTATGYQEKK